VDSPLFDTVKKMGFGKGVRAGCGATKRSHAWALDAMEERDAAGNRGWPVSGDIIS
jgi:hypothetical protein